MAANIKPDDEPFGPFTVAEVENCFKAFDLDNNNFVGAGELRKFAFILSKYLTAYHNKKYTEFVLIYYLKSLIS